jgi:GT2 family glycosyltransferase
MIKQPAVLIIILNWNGSADTLACLASLEKLEYPAYSTLVIDNGSTDNSVAAIRQHYPHLPIIETGANLGYAAGNNVGLRYAQEQGYAYALLLNNDTEVAPDFLTPLVDICEQTPSIGAVGPKILFYDHPTTLWAAGAVIDWQQGGRTYMRGLQEIDRGQYNAVEDVDFVTGCACLVRCSLLANVGLLDERFGMYYEETEWCVRIQRAGWRIVYVPTSKIWHKVQIERQDRAPYITYYMARNRLLFLRATHAAPTTWLYAIFCQDLRTWLSWRIRPKWRHRHAQRLAMQRGWQDFMRGHFGMVAR